MTAAIRKNPTTSNRFIPEIQGLRTIALLLVATFHIWVGRISGGVDVFLLISAYLLTRSLTASSERGISPATVTYIIKKFARLLPLAATTVVLVIIAALTLMPASTISTMLGDAASGLLYFENFHLQAQAVDYYANTHGSASLFQHFWSLSIQGQVFVVWPVLHLIGHGIAKKTGLRVRSVLTVIFGAVFLGSLVWSIYWTAQNQTLAYFDTFARLWEFAAGSLLALLPLSADRIPAWLRSVMSWLGVAGVISCGIVLPVQSTFPGFAALWPVISASLIITAAGTPTKFGADRILTTRLLTTIGGYTYALYLVHWPVLVLFLRLTGQNQASLGEGTLLLLISGVVSFIITRVVELPTSRFLARAPKVQPELAWHVRFRRTVTRPVTVIVIAVLVAGGVVGGSELQRQARVAAEQEALASVNVALLGANAPDMPITKDPVPDGSVLTEQQIFSCESCANAPYVCKQIISDPAAPLVYLVGNSHTERFTNVVFETASRTTPMNVRSHAAPGCAFDYVDNPDPTNACQQLWSLSLDYIAANKPAAVVVMATLSTTDSGDVTFAGLPGWIERVKSLSPQTTVIAIRDTPRFTEVPYDCALTEGWGAQQCEHTYTRADISAYQRQITSTGAVWVDVNDGICIDGICRPQVGGLVTYYDSNHLTAPYMRSLAQLFADQVSPSVSWWPKKVF